MSSKLSKVGQVWTHFLHRQYADARAVVIARNALAQEESEEFNGDFSDPINIHLDQDRDGCAC